MDVLKDYLHEKKTLIILDNCEHLVSASAQVANTLLNAAPRLKILATSREALGVKGEQSYPVPSLSFPDPKGIPVIDQLSKYEAVRLFIDRAMLVAPHFVVDRDNAPHIAQICHRLDGIPLAIELAAARVRLLSVEQISYRLDDRFRLLTSGARTALPRQQTLRAMIDWSYDLLSEYERLFLQRLSVFAGSWNLEAAEVVCSGEGIESFDVFDLLAQLVNKSLVVVIENHQRGETRYRMLETIRQYAREKLLESGQEEELHDRHFNYFLQTVKQARSEYFSPKEIFWLVWLDNEWDNLRAAVEWSSVKHPDRALELVNNLGDLFLDHASNASEMDHWLTQLLAHEQNSTRTARRARGLYQWAIFVNFSRETGVSSEARIDESLSIYTELGDKEGLAHGYLTKVLCVYGVENSSLLYEKAVGLYRETQNKLGLSQALHFYGLFIEHWKIERKLTYLEESLSIRRELGYTTGIIESLKQLGAIHIRMGDFGSAHRVLQEGISNLNAHVSVLGNSITMSYDLGDLAFYEGHYDLAQGYYEDALSWADQKGLPGSADWAKVRLGYLYLQKSELEESKFYFQQVLSSFRKYGNNYGIVFILEGFAGLAIARQEWEKAIRLFSSLSNLREEMQLDRSPVEQTFIDNKLAIMHSQVDDLTFENVWKEGSALTLEQAIALTLQEETA
jgi:predicted ATPase